MLMLMLLLLTAPLTCQPGHQFRCSGSGRCIPSDWLCDGEADCGTSDDSSADTSDEDPLKCNLQYSLYLSIKSQHYPARNSFAVRI